MAKEILLNALYMNSACQIAQGMWRHPRDTSRNYTKLSYWVELARTLEAGKFDALFLADVFGVYDVFEGSPRAAIRNATQIPINDPFLVIPTMSAATEHLGFGVTGTLTYEPPLPFARRMSTLDHLTNGRVAWNIVTGYLKSATKSAGMLEHPSHDIRYDIAEEFMEIMYKLWESSWSDDAVIHDKDSCTYTDPAGVRSVKHDGTYLQLEGVHICEPSPQRTPVLYQAGASAKGKLFAARHAECIFLAARSRSSLRRTIAEIHDLAATVGRTSADIKTFAWMTVIPGRTDDEAHQKLEEYRRYVSHEGALALVSGWTGMDFSKFNLDDRLEDNVESDAIRSITEMFTGVDAGNVWTVRGVAEHIALAGSGPLIVGSPTTVADELELWIDETGVDGFNLGRIVAPETYTDFVELIVPELQRRGRYKTEYRAGSFREKLFRRGDRLAPPHVGASFRF